MKKLIVLLFVLCLTAALFAGCTPKEETPATLPATAADSGPVQPPAEPAWTLAVVTADGEKAFTSIDAEPLTVVEMDATTKNKEGVEKTYSYKGYLLSDILAAVGVADFTSITGESSDAYTAELDKALALNDDTIIAFERDGEALEPLTLVPAQGTGNQFVKMLIKITVNA